MVTNGSRPDNSPPSIAADLGGGELSGRMDKSDFEVDFSESIPEFRSFTVKPKNEKDILTIFSKDSLFTREQINIQLEKNLLLFSNKELSLNLKKLIDNQLLESLVINDEKFYRLKTHELQCGDCIAFLSKNKKNYEAKVVAIVSPNESFHEKVPQPVSDRYIVVDRELERVPYTRYMVLIKKLQGKLIRDWYYALNTKTQKYKNIDKLEPSVFVEEPLNKLWLQLSQGLKPFVSWKTFSHGKWVQQSGFAISIINPNESIKEKGLKGKKHYLSDQSLYIRVLIIKEDEKNNVNIYAPLINLLDNSI